MTNSKSIGMKLVAARKQASLSQADLAKQISISSQAVGKWERGESLPDVVTLNRIATLLYVDLNYFSEQFHTPDLKISTLATVDVSIDAGIKQTWNLSQSNWVDTDFSGLNNVHEQFNASNLQACSFVGSNLSEIQFSGNNIEKCDFTNTTWKNSKIQSSNLGNNNFENSVLQAAIFLKCNVEKCVFEGADFSRATLKNCNFTANRVQNAIWFETNLERSALQHVVFDGVIENCFFENCTFYDVKFENATLINTFFKNNRKMKKVQFIDCKVDKLTYAFLKSNQANLDGVTLLTE